jgi:hypothetical protein
MKMPWFKHYNNASSSLSIQIMMNKLGVIGYGQYFLLLELLCSKFDGSNSVIDLSSIEIENKLRIKPFRIDNILRTFQESNLLEYSRNNFIIRITCPILLELQGKDFKHNRKRIAEESQQATLDIRYKNKIKDKEEDKEIIKEKVVTDLLPVVDKITEIQDGLNKKENKLNWILEIFNETSHIHQMPKIKVISKDREKAISRGIKEIGEDRELWKKVFLIAGKKGFVKKDGQSWSPDFDYVFRAGNPLRFSEEDPSKKITLTSLTDHVIEQKINNPYRRN